MNGENVEDAGRQARYIAIELRLPMLVAVLTLILAGFALCFWVGVMVGEGDAALNALIPPPRVAEEPLASEEESYGDLEPIPPEELVFQERLRQSSDPPEDRPPSAESLISGFIPEAIPVTQPGGALFHYQFQVASFVRQQQAAELAARLVSGNLNASVETADLQGVMRYRVLIAFQGTEDGVQLLRRRLKRDFNLEDILQRSKRPG